MYRAHEPERGGTIADTRRVRVRSTELGPIRGGVCAASVQTSGRVRFSRDKLTRVRVLAVGSVTLSSSKPSVRINDIVATFVERYKNAKNMIRRFIRCMDRVDPEGEIEGDHNVSSRFFFSIKTSLSK